jgi:F-type H+-transporting ATPase subunit epsilon
MAKRFPLSVLTPERVFYSGEATSVTVESIGGRLGVLADHVPMVTALTVGELVIRTADDTPRIAFHSEGFMEVTREGVYIFCQTCEWPEEIDLNRAEQAQQRAQQRLQSAGDPSFMSKSHIALVRAVKRIQVKRESINDK